MILVFYITTGLCFIPVLALFHRCPSKEDLSPCSCQKTGNEVKLQCIRVTHKETKEVLSRLEFFVIDDMTLNYINDLDLTSNLFRKLNVHNFNIMNSNIQRFSLFKTFLSLHEIVNSIKVINSTVKEFQLSASSHFIRLKSLVFDSTNIVGIFSQLISILPKHIKKFSAIGTSNFGIDFIGNDGFSKFSWINELDLSHNRIINLQRSMFPKPARRLQTLNLGYNKISYLPDDMFAEMPRMEFLYLNHNPLLSLQWTIFKPIWNQLEYADLQGIKINCNCDLIWILRFRPPATIKSPSCESKTGVHVITDLSIPDLCQKQQ